MYINKCQLYGNLTKDPELKSLPSGSVVCNFTVATNRKWKDKNSGEQKEEPQFTNVVVFGKTAENVAKYMRKGSPILVEGRLQTRSWDAKDGSKRYSTEVFAEQVQFGPKRVGQEESRQDDAQTTDPNYGGVGEINPDDIPF